MMDRSQTVRGLRHRRVVIEGGDVRPQGWRLVRDSCRMGHGKPIEWLAFRAPAFSWLPAGLVAFAVLRFRPDPATWESMLLLWARSPAPVAVAAGLPPHRLDGGDRARRRHGGGVAGGGTPRSDRDRRLCVRDQPPGLDCGMVARTAELSPAVDWPATRVRSPPRPDVWRPAARAGAAACAHPQAVIVVIGDASVMISTSSRDSLANARHMATSSQESQVPWSSPVASSTTV